MIVAFETTGHRLIEVMKLGEEDWKAVERLNADRLGVVPASSFKTHFKAYKSKFTSGRELQYLVK